MGVWGLDLKNEVYFGDEMFRDVMIKSDWFQVSAGPMGVWGLDLKNEIYFRDGTFGDPEDSEGTGWTKVGSFLYRQCTGSSMSSS